MGSRADRLWELLKSLGMQENQQVVFHVRLIDLTLIQARSAAVKKVADSVTEFETYIRSNREFIPNFGERLRQGETISTAFAEPTIDQVVSRRFVKKQQMAWTLRAAHILLQTRTKVLNNELDEVFRAGTRNSDHNRKRRNQRKGQHDPRSSDALGLPVDPTLEVVRIGFKCERG